MLDIMCADPGDDVVRIALDALIHDRVCLLHIGGNLRLHTPDGTVSYGNGGAGVKTLIVLGHGSSSSIDGYSSWNSYAAQKNWNKCAEINFAEKTKVYLAACNTSEDGTSNYFLYRNFADTVKLALPGATVWASSSPVQASDLSGDWEKA